MYHFKNKYQLRSGKTKKATLWDCDYIHVIINMLKGLGHAILDNFSTDQIIIELT